MDPLRATGSILSARVFVPMRHDLRSYAHAGRAHWTDAVEVDRIQMELVVVEVLRCLP